MANRLDISDEEWQTIHPILAVHKLPQEQRVIDIYQSRSAPDESHLAHDWDIYLMPEDLPEAFFDCALLGLFVTVPAFLLFRLLQSQQQLR